MGKNLQLKESINSVKNEQNKTDLSKFYTLILYFLIFSFIGWLAETLYCLYELGHFTKRGFLYGPLCPIYGWGALILIVFFNKYKGHNIKLFIYAAIIFSLFEYVVGYGMDALFSTRWWDYTNEFFNLNGRISFFYSFVWGIAAILFINIIFPFFERTVKKSLNQIPYKIQLHSVRILGLVFILDTIISFVKNLI